MSRFDSASNLHGSRPDLSHSSLLGYYRYYDVLLIAQSRGETVNFFSRIGKRRRRGFFFCDSSEAQMRLNSPNSSSAFFFFFAGSILPPLNQHCLCLPFPQTYPGLELKQVEPRRPHPVQFPLLHFICGRTPEMRQRHCLPPPGVGSCFITEFLESEAKKKKKKLCCSPM